MKNYFMDYQTKESNLRQWWPGAVVLLIVHILLCLFMGLTYYFEILTIEHWYTIFAYFLIYQLILTFTLILGYYTQLRNTKIYVAWLLVAIVQTIVYYQLNDVLDLTEKEHRHLTPLRTLLPMLLSFQFFRLLFKRFTTWELIIPYKRSDWYDEADNRKIIWLDILFSILIYCIIICSLIL